jgi:hypothetical protein
MEIETVQLWAFGKVNYNNYQLISIVLFVFSGIPNTFF